MWWFMFVEITAGRSSGGATDGAGGTPWQDIFFGNKVTQRQTIPNDLQEIRHWWFLNWLVVLNNIFSGMF